MITLDRGIFNLLIFIICILAVAVAYFIYRVFMAKERALEIIELLVGIIEAGDPNLDGHSLHVHNLSMVMYEFLPYFYRMKISQRDLHYASLLLDIGKLGIPKEILERSGKLKNNEWDIIRKHPDLGIEMIKSVPGFVNVRSYILYHHERMDGKGYHQLAGDQIPIGARIIAIADTYSAITMDRSYKPSLPYAEAISELKMAAGSQLDEELVEIFCNIPMSRIDDCLVDVRYKMARFAEGRKGK